MGTDQGDTSIGAQGDVNGVLLVELDIINILKDWFQMTLYT